METQSYWPPFQNNESVMRAQINGDLVILTTFQKNVAVMRAQINGDLVILTTFQNNEAVVRAQINGDLVILTTFQKNEAVVRAQINGDLVILTTSQKNEAVVISAVVISCRSATEVESVLLAVGLLRRGHSMLDVGEGSCCDGEFMEREAMDVGCCDLVPHEINVVVSTPVCAPYHLIHFR